MQECCAHVGTCTLGKGFMADDDTACDTVSDRNQYMPQQTLTLRAGFETVLIRPVIRA